MTKQPLVLSQMLAKLNSNIEVEQPVSTLHTLLEKAHVEILIILFRRTPFKCSLITSNSVWISPISLTHPRARARALSLSLSLSLSLYVTIYKFSLCWLGFKRKCKSSQWNHWGSAAISTAQGKYQTLCFKILQNSAATKAAHKNLNLATMKWFAKTSS